MNVTQIIINGYTLDLEPSTTVTKTIQAFDLFNQGRVIANYTNQFNAPKTPTNQQIFQSASNPKSTTRLPYQTMTCTVIQNGITLFSNGYALMKDVDSNYSLSIFDGNYGFFGQIATLSLVDIDLTSLIQSWNDAAQYAARVNTTGIIPAFIDFGQLSAPAGVVTSDGTKFQPSIYLSSLITAMFATFGYTASGKFLTDARFLKVIMPLQSNYTAAYAGRKRLSAYGTGAQAMFNPAAGQTVQFNVGVSQGADNFYDGTDTYTVGYPTGTTFTGSYFIATFESVLAITVSGGAVDLIMTTNGVDVTLFGNKGTGIYDLYTPGVYCKRGDVFKIKIKTFSGTPSITITSAKFTVYCPVTSPGQNWPGSATGNVGIVPQFLLPDMLITDFIKNLSIIFGLLFKEKNGVIYIANITDVINDRVNAIDWTSKRSLTIQEKVTFQFNDYAQVNTLRWSVDADPSLDEFFASGHFDVPNVNLEKTTELTSEFNSSTTAIVSTTLPININTASIKIWDATAGKYVATVGLRLLMVRDPIAAEPTVRFGAQPATATYKPAYFQDGSQAAGDLDFAQLLPAYYSGFINAMKNAKMITRPYNLNDVDILSFDPFKIIFDDGEYFIVNKISNYIPGKLTQVELFKL